MPDVSVSLVNTNSRELLLACLESLRGTNAEIVVLDIRLPDMSGLDVARRLNAGPNPPLLILISSGDRREYEQVAHEAGARGFIPKADFTAQAVRLLADRP